jgi:hypothetical protein
MKSFIIIGPTGVAVVWAVSIAIVWTKSYERLGVRASLAIGSHPLAKRRANSRKSSEHPA